MNYTLDRTLPDSARTVSIFPKPKSIPTSEFTEQRPGIGGPVRNLRIEYVSNPSPPMPFPHVMWDLPAAGAGQVTSYTITVTPPC